MTLPYFSAFSGIGGFEIGIHEALPQAVCVGYSEIDKYADGIYRMHWTSHRNFGDITMIDPKAVPDFKLFVAGFPCTDLAICNVENLGLDGARSGLILPAVRLMEAKQPDYFVIENVASMKDANRDKISKLLGVEPVLLNAADVSAQNRERYFWANFKITPLPKVKIPRLEKLLDPWDIVNKYALSEREIAYMNRKVKGGRNHWDFAHHHDTDRAKSQCLPANLHKGVPYNVILDRRKDAKNPLARKLTAVEAERIMGFPADYTKFGPSTVSNTRRYKTVGNSVSIPVIRHIFESLVVHMSVKKAMSKLRRH